MHTLILCLLYTVGKTLNMSLAGRGETNPPLGSFSLVLSTAFSWTTCGEKKGSVMNADVGIRREIVRVDLTLQVVFFISFFPPVSVSTLAHIVFPLIR